MTDTPRTDAEARSAGIVKADFARKLERQLNAAAVTLQRIAHDYPSRTNDDAIAWATEALRQLEEAK